MADNGMLDVLHRIEADLAEIKTGHGRLLNLLLQEVRLIRVTMNDLVRDSVTTGKVTALHEDFTRMQRDLDSLSARVEVALTDADHRQAIAMVTPLKKCDRASLCTQSAALGGATAIILAPSSVPLRSVGPVICIRPPLRGSGPVLLRYSDLIFSITRLPEPSLLYESSFA